MEYSTIQLTDISISNLTPVKISLRHYGEQDHCRWVFRESQGGGSNTLFYKIWNPSYVRRDNILAAIASGFYDERTVPAFYGLVFHKGLCRGYVMNKGTIRYNAFNDQIREFLCLRTYQTGYFCYQFAPWHTMVYDNGWSLFDLEGVYPIEDLPRLAKYHCEFDDPAYEQYVADLYKQLFPPTAVSVGETASQEDPTADVSLSAGNTVRTWTVMRRYYSRGLRKLAQRARNCVPRIDLIQY
ncbi:MAG: hypothetical protein QNJ07_14430 [Woeseiaceae bacterium]|nr:hypothetical protein [Woeseiaceae bacterium]